MNKTAREIQDEIIAWAKHNFEYQDIVGDGMVEEIGEFCRARLKFKQKIRGQAGKSEEEREDKRDEDLYDAIGDAGIFCLHWSGIHGGFLSFDTADRFATVASDMGENEILGHLLQVLGRIIMFADSRHVHEDEYRIAGQRYLDHLAALANKHDWDLQHVIKVTWNNVKQRDWIKYPKTGFGPATGT